VCCARSKVGDFVSVGGVSGTIHELGLFGTTIVTPDNVLTLIGNGKIFSDHDPELLGVAIPSRRRTAQLAGGVDHADRDRALQGRRGEDPERYDRAGPDVSLLDLNLVGPVIAVRP